MGFDLERFIREKVTGRERSLLADDFERYDAELHQQIDGKRVLVIGGAGSIGSHYIKAILRYDVAALYVVDINENGLTELVRDLRSDGSYCIPDEFVTYPVNFGDAVFAKLFEAHGPFQIVANFAAHKHVRSEKDVFSIEAMIENNLLRARGLLDLLCEYPPEHFFCVSTDKAANPVNIMGASKKLMEELIMAYSERLPIKTARFANVAFSNGSLPAGFLERIAKRQPWSCPLGIRRFFVSLIEAGELCLMASVMGESGDIVFPRLDEERDMIPFEWIARELLAALGLGVQECGSEAEARGLLQPQSGCNAEVKRGSERLAAEGRGDDCNHTVVAMPRLTGRSERRAAEGRGDDCNHGVVAMPRLKGKHELGAEGRGAAQPPDGRSDEGKKERGSQAVEGRKALNTNLQPLSGCKKGGKWPVYFFASDTSGEKAFEEFYTPGEELDLEKFVNLGVVKNSKKRPMREIDEIFVKLRTLFEGEAITKAKVVEVLRDYLPNFEHIETGKGLDGKM
ncbi:MAG: polysaccharide biosynthesis protein [Kiritimatiellae bacterium]|nr:polysaccharide biosynthesis protein [Kiritimatiellia bacterium]